MSMAAARRACGTQTAQVEFSPNDALTAAGVVISTISSSGSSTYEEELAGTKHELRSIFQEVHGMIGSKDHGTELYGRTDQSMLDALRVALAAGWLYDPVSNSFKRFYKIENHTVYEQWEALSGVELTCSSTHRDSLQVKESPIRDDNFYASGPAKMLSYTIRLNLVDRRFVMLANGYFGFATVACQPGDTVVALGGGPTPYVLRQVPGGTEYTYVGDAYIHGMMDGEAFEENRPLEKFTIV
ncbi:Nn.00g117430.m01.CDS01 [Neocucurbitaria sp. VM-36]